MASNLEKAYRNYGKKKRSAFAKQKKAEWQDRMFTGIGDTLMSSAKLYKKNIEPNLQKWKDVEAGYDALDVAEADRYKPRSFLGVPYEKMGMKPKNISKKALDKQGIVNIESGGRSYTLGDVRGLGASLSDQSPEMKALMRDDSRSMKDFFGTKLPKTTSTVELGGEKMEGTLEDVIKMEKLPASAYGQQGYTNVADYEAKEILPKKMTDNLTEMKNEFGSYKKMYQQSYGKKASFTDKLFGPMDSSTGKRLKTDKDYEEFFRKEEMNQFTESAEQKSKQFQAQEGNKRKEIIEKQNARFTKGKSDVNQAMEELNEQIKSSHGFYFHRKNANRKKKYGGWNEETGQFDIVKDETTLPYEELMNTIRWNEDGSIRTENIFEDIEKNKEKWKGQVSPSENPEDLKPMSDIGVTSGSQHWIATQDKDNNWVREQLNVTAVSGTKKALMANKREISFADIIQGKKSYADLLKKKHWLELDSSWNNVI